MKQTVSIDRGDIRVSDFGSAVIDALVDVLDYHLISVEQLGAMSNYSLEYLSNVLGKQISPTLTDIENLCSVLGLRPNEFLGEIPL